MSKHYTAEDVSDDVENLIKSEVSEKLETWTPLTYKSGIAINWNHSPDRLTWRWEDDKIYVGKIKVCFIIEHYSALTGLFSVYSPIIDNKFESILMKKTEAREACEKIADEFINSLTTK